MHLTFTSKSSHGRRGQYAESPRGTILEWTQKGVQSTVRLAFWCMRLRRLLMPLLFAFVAASYSAIEQASLATVPTCGSNTRPTEAGVTARDDPLPNGALLRFGSTRFRSPNPIVSLTYTPDGQFLVGGCNGPAVVWEAGTGKPIRHLGGDLPQPLGRAHLSPSGKYVAVGGFTPETVAGGAVYEIGTGRQLYRFGRRGGSYCALFARRKVVGCVLDILRPDGPLGS